MFPKTLIANVLSSTLGMYVEDLDPEHLQVDIFQGDVVLEDLTLKPSALDALSMPVVLLHGSVGRLEMHIPWDVSMRSSPVTITLRDVFILTGPAAQTEYDEDTERAAELRAKREALDAADLAAATQTEAAAAAASRDSAGVSGFMQSLVTKIVDNIQIRIENVHVRYEDAASRQGGQALAGGLTLASIAIESTNSKWEPSFISDQSSTFFHKLASLSSLAMYFNPADEIMLATMSRAERIAAFRDLIYSPDSAAADALRWILVPTHGVAKARVKRTETYQGKPKLSLDLAMEPIALHINRAQYVGISELSDSLATYSRTAKYRKFRPRGGVRPTTHPRAWWLYAIRSVRSDVAARNVRSTLAYLVQRRSDRINYIALHKARVYAANGSAAPLEPDDLARLDELESRLPLDDLRFFRSLARAEMRNEAKQLAAMQGSDGWLSSISSWLGFTSTSPPDPDSLDDIYGDNAQSAIAPGSAPTSLPVQRTPVPFVASSPSKLMFSPKERKALLTAIDYDETAAAAHTPADIAHDYVATKVTLSLPSLSVTLTHDRRDVLSVNIDGLLVDYRARAAVMDSFLFHASLYSLVIADPSATSARFSGLVAPRKLSHASGSGSGSGLGSGSAAAHSDALDFKILSLTLEKNPASNLVDWSLSVTTEDLEMLFSAPALSRIAAFAALPSRLAVLQRVRASYEQSLASIQSAAQNSLSSVLSSHLRLDIHLNVKAPHIVIPYHPSPDAPALVIDLGRLHLKSDLSSLAQLDASESSLPPASAYETYKLRMRAMQVMLVPLTSGPALSSSHGYNGLASQLVDKFDINVSIRSCIARRSDMPQTIVDAQLPNIGLRISSLDYFNLNNILDMLAEPIVPPPQQQPGVLDDGCLDPDELGAPAAPLEYDDIHGIVAGGSASGAPAARSGTSFMTSASRVVLSARFEIQALSLTLASATGSRPSPIVVLDLKSLATTYESRKYESNLALSLLALDIHDANPASPFTSLATSVPASTLRGVSSLVNASLEPRHGATKLSSLSHGSIDLASPAEASRLIHINVLQVDPDAPNFASDHDSFATTVDMSFNQLHLSFNPKTIAAVMDFVSLGAVVDTRAHDDDPDSHTTADDSESAAGLDESGDATDSAARAGPGPGPDATDDDSSGLRAGPSPADAALAPSSTLRIDAHLEALTLRINTENKPFVSVAVLGSSVSHRVTTTSAMTRASLGDLAVVDMSLSSRRWRRILESAPVQGSGGLDADGSAATPPLLAASYSVAHATGDTAVTLSMSPVRFVFLQRFISSVEAWQATVLAPLLGPGLGAPLSDAQMSMSEAPSSVRDGAAVARHAAGPGSGSKSSASSTARSATSSKLGLDIVIRSPTLVVPQSSHAKDHIIADLGHISLSNVYKPVDAPDVLLDSWSLDIANMHLLSVTSDTPERIVESIDINIGLARPFFLAKRKSRAARALALPDLDVSGSSDPIHVTVTKPQYDLVLTVMDDNLSEAPAHALFGTRRDVARAKSVAMSSRDVSVSLRSDVDSLSPFAALSTPTAQTRDSEPAFAATGPGSAARVLQSMSFTMPELRVTIAGTTRATPIATLSLRGFAVTYMATATLTKVSLSLQGLTVTDMLKAAALETGIEYHLASSMPEADPAAVADNLVNVVYTAVSPDDLRFESDYNATLTHVSMYFSRLSLHVNPPVLLALLAFSQPPRGLSGTQPPNFVLQTPPGSPYASSSPVDSLSSFGCASEDGSSVSGAGASADGLDGGVPELVTTAAPEPSPTDDPRVATVMRVTAHVGGLSLSVDADHYEPLMDAQLVGARGGYRLAPDGCLSIEAVMSDLVVTNTTPSAGLFRKVVFVRGENAMRLVMTSYIHASGLRAYDMNVQGGELNVVYVHAFVDAVTSTLSSSYVLSSPGGAAGPDHALNGGTGEPNVEPDSRAGESGPSDDASRPEPTLMLYSVNFASPTVIVPRNPSSNQVILLDLGEIEVSNTVSDTIDEAGVLYSSTLVSFTNVNIQGGEKGHLTRQLVGNLDLKATARQPLTVKPGRGDGNGSHTPLPPTRVSATVGNVVITLARAEYVLLMRVINENLGSKAPPAAMGVVPPSPGPMMHSGPGRGVPLTPSRFASGGERYSGSAGPVVGPGGAGNNSAAQGPPHLTLVGDVSLGLLAIDVFRDDSDLGAARRGGDELAILSMAVRDTALSFETESDGAVTSVVSVASIELEDKRHDTTSVHRTLLAPLAEPPAAADGAADAMAALRVSYVFVPSKGTTVDIVVHGVRVIIVTEALVAFAAFFTENMPRQGPGPTGGALHLEGGGVGEPASGTLLANNAASMVEPRSMTGRLRMQARQSYVVRSDDVVATPSAMASSSSATTPGSPFGSRWVVPNNGGGYYDSGSGGYESRSPMSASGDAAVPAPTRLVFKATVTVTKPQVALVLHPSHPDSVILVLGLQRGLLFRYASRGGTRGPRASIKVNVGGLEAYVAHMNQDHSSETSLVSPFDIDVAVKDTTLGLEVAVDVPHQVDMRVTARELGTCMAAAQLLSSLSTGPAGASSEAAAASNASLTSKTPASTASPVRAESLSVALTSVSVKLVDDADSQMRDMVELVCNDVVVKADSWTRGLNVHGTAALSAEHFNPVVAEWEPLVEPWKFEAEAHLRSSPSSQFVRVFATDPLRVNVSPSGMQALLGATALVGSASGVSPAPEGGLVTSSFAPYHVHNMCGHSIRLWVKASEHAVDIEHGATGRFQFPVKRHRVRRSVALQVAGGWSRVEAVDIDAVGVRTYMLAPRMHDVDHRLVCEVSMRPDGAKELVVRSSILVRNDTEQALQLHLDVGLGEAVVLPPLEPGRVTSIPVQYVYQATVRVRAVGGPTGKSAWSSQSVSWMDADGGPQSMCLNLGSEPGMWVMATLTEQSQVTAMAYPYPRHVLVFSSPVTLYNGLPVALSFAFDDARETSGTIGPGDQVALLSVPPVGWRVSLGVPGQAGGRDTVWSETTVLAPVRRDVEGGGNLGTTLPAADRAAVHLVRAGLASVEFPGPHPRLEVVHAQVARTLARTRIDLAQLAGPRPEALGHALVVYAPVWLINSTGMAGLELGEVQGPGVVRPLARLSDETPWLHAMAHPEAAVAVRTSACDTWSAPLAVSPIAAPYTGASVALSHEAPESHLACSLTQAADVGIASRSLILRVTPRTVIVNQTGLSLYFQYDVAGAPTVELEPDGQSPLHLATQPGLGELVDVPLVVSLDAGGEWSWSLGFQVGRLDERAPHLLKVSRVHDSRAGKRVAVLAAEVCVRDGVRFVVMEVVPREKWPIRIVNETSLALSVRQSHLSQSLVVEPGTETRYAWDDAGEPQILAVTPAGMASVARATQTVVHTFAMDQISAIPQMVTFVHVDVQDREARLPVSALVSVDENDGVTHVLTLRDASTTRTMPRPGPGPGPGASSGPVSSSESESALHVHLATVLVSLINGKGVEVATVTLGELRYSTKTVGEVTDMEVAVDWVQADDPELLAQYPVVLAPVVDGGSPGAVAVWQAQRERQALLMSDACGARAGSEVGASTHETEGGARAAGGEQLEDEDGATSSAPGFRTLHLVSVTRAGLPVSFYDVCAVRMARMVVQIDETWMQAFLEWMWEVFWPSSQGSETVPGSQVAGPRLDVGEFEAGRQASTQQYYRSLDIHGIALDVTFTQADGGMRAGTSGAAGQAGSWVDVVFRALDMTLLNIESANISLGAVNFAHKHTDWTRLSNELWSVYMGELLTCVHQIVGSFEILGNPAGLAASLQHGAWDLVALPASGVVAMSPSAVGVGLVRGLLSFMRHSSVGVLSSANSVANSLSKGLAVVLPGEHARAVQERTRERLRAAQPTGWVDGLAVGVGFLSQGLVDGALGVVSDPWRTLWASGPSAAAVSMAVGLLGTVVRPAVGALDMATATSAGCRTTAARLLASSAFVRPVRRVRLQRVLGLDGHVSTWDSRGAVIQALVWSVDGGRFCGAVPEVILAHLCIGPQAESLLVLTRTWILVLDPPAGLLDSCDPLAFAAGATPLRTSRWAIARHSIVGIDRPDPGTLAIVLRGSDPDRVLQASAGDPAIESFIGLL